MIVKDVMKAVAARLDTIDGLRVYDYPADTVAAPAAVVAYPDEIEYDLQYRRATDRMVLPVFVFVGRQNDKGARDRLVTYTDGDGVKSVKAVLESGTYTAFDDIRVASVQFDAYQVGAVEYAGAAFELHILGPGANR